VNRPIFLALQATLAMTAAALIYMGFGEMGSVHSMSQGLIRLVMAGMVLLAQLKWITLGRRKAFLAKSIDLAEPRA
jgi:hypothetical protein